jgi:hypothetical protein
LQLKAEDMNSSRRPSAQFWALFPKRGKDCQEFTLYETSIRLVLHSSHILERLFFFSCSTGV